MYKDNISLINTSNVVYASSYWYVQQGWIYVGGWQRCVLPPTSQCSRPIDFSTYLERSCAKLQAELTVRYAKSVHPTWTQLGPPPQTLVIPFWIHRWCTCLKQHSKDVHIHCVPWQFTSNDNFVKYYLIWIVLYCFKHEENIHVFTQGSIY